MACGGVTGLVQHQLTALSATGVVKWFTDWMPCVGMDTIIPFMRCRNASTDYFEAQIVLQTANVLTSEPNSVQTVGAQQTPSSGIFNYNPGTTDISSNTSGAMFVRFGVSYEYTSGQSQCSADIELQVSYKQCGAIRGAGSFDLATSTTALRYQTVTGMVPAVEITKVKAAVSCTSLTGNFQWRVYYRTAQTTPDTVGAWSVVTDASAPYQAGNTNTGELSVSPGSNMWVQFAIGYNLSSAGDGQASLTAAVATRS